MSNAKGVKNERSNHVNSASLKGLRQVTSGQNCLASSPGVNSPCDLAGTSFPSASPPEVLLVSRSLLSGFRLQLGLLYRERRLSCTCVLVVTKTEMKNC